MWKALSGLKPKFQKTNNKVENEANCLSKINLPHQGNHPIFHKSFSFGVDGFNY